MSLNEISLSGGHLAGLMQAVLEKNACFRFKARGHSMTPFIRDGDVITLAPAGGRRVGAGDVAAVVNGTTGSVIVHRIVGRKGAEFLIKGDNCRLPDGGFAPDRILGVARLVERDGRAAWFASGPEKRLVAVLSRTGILNRILLPGLRKTKQGVRPGAG